MDTSPANLQPALMTALNELTRALDETGVTYALIGGLAAGFRSQPRFTEDVDVLLQIPQVMLPRLLDNLQKRGFEFDANTLIRQWNVEHMTVLTIAGVQVDWLKPVLPCFQHVIETAREEIWQDTAVRIASAEGLILMKLIAFRQQDLADIESLLAANRSELNPEWIRRELLTVVSADDPRKQHLDEMLDELSLNSESDSEFSS